MFTPITLSTAIEFTREQPELWYFIEASDVFGWSPFECTGRAVAHAVAAHEACKMTTPVYVVRNGAIIATYTA